MLYLAGFRSPVRGVKLYKSKPLGHSGGLVDWQTDIDHLATLGEDAADPHVAGMSW